MDAALSPPAVRRTRTVSAAAHARTRTPAAARRSRSLEPVDTAPEPVEGRSPRRTRRLARGRGRARQRGQRRRPASSCASAAERCSAAAPAVPRFVWVLVVAVVLENLPGCRSRGWSSAGSTSASRRSWTAAAPDDPGDRRLMLFAIGLQTVSRMYFLRQSGRVGQDVLLELRRRLFRHFQRLDVAFHDRYTTGRVVVASTNDIDAIAELLERLRRPGHRRADHGRRRHPDARPRPAPRSGLPDLLPAAGRAACWFAARPRPHLPTRSARAPPWSSCSSSRP